MFIQERIQQYTGSIRALARMAGVGKSTIIDIRDGRNTNPGIRTVARIEAALDRLQAAEQAPQEVAS